MKACAPLKRGEKGSCNTLEEQCSRTFNLSAWRTVARARKCMDPRLNQACFTTAQVGAAHAAGGSITHWIAVIEDMIDVSSGS
jgi:hypothetical protein